MSRNSWKTGLTDSCDHSRAEMLITGKMSLHSRRRAGRLIDTPQSTHPSCRKGIRLSSEPVGAVMDRHTLKLMMPETYQQFLGHLGWECTEGLAHKSGAERWIVIARRDGHTIISRWPDRVLAWRAAAKLSVKDKP